MANGYELVCCDRCGFVYADTAVTQEDYDRFYASYSKYEDKKIATGGGESSSDAHRLDVVRTDRVAQCAAISSVIASAVRFETDAVAVNVPAER